MIEKFKSNAEAIATADKYLYGNHARMPIVMDRGEGCWVWDLDNNKYLDFVGGIAVNGLGHHHPAIVEALDRAKDMMHCSNYYYNEPAIQVCKLICENSCFEKVLFANSGAEADENAVKIARAYTGRPNLITFSGAFHGRTLLTMTLTAKKAYTTGLGPLATGVYRAQFPYLYRSPDGLSEEEVFAACLQSLQDVFEEGTPADQVAALILEPLQGEGGFLPAPLPWVKALRKVCDDHGILLIADEVQSGFCRTGRMFASEYWQEAGAAPDILTAAKSIAAGLPISAIVARSEIMDAVPAGTIGGTYCGNPLACAAALKTIELMERDDLAARSRQIGQIVTARCAQWQTKFPLLGDVRGLGAMIGLEFVKDPVTKAPNGDLVSALVQECARHGLLIENAGRWGQVVRFLAPLTITDHQLHCGLDILENALKTCTQ